jgi:hypothetical protein
MTLPFSPKSMIRNLLGREDRAERATPSPAPAAPTAPAAPAAPAARERADSSLARFDTGGLQLLEDVGDAEGFDPYGHRNVHDRRTTEGERTRTDLRELSQQILAERARKQQTG